MSNVYTDIPIDREGDLPTVRELIAALEKLPQDKEIVIVYSPDSDDGSVHYAESVRNGKHLCAIVCQ